MPGDALDAFERERIRDGIARGQSLRAIARRIGRSASTVSREVRRNGKIQRYSAVSAQRRADLCRRRPRARHLVANPGLAKLVRAELKAGYSPKAVSVRLRDAGHDMVCAETIYQSLYCKEFSGLGLLPERCLRSRRSRRRARSERARRPGPSWRDYAPSIDLRPKHVNTRKQPGHWEGDLIVGVGNHSAVASLVERTTRYLILVKITSRHASSFARTLQDVFAPVPDHLRRSLTWDQGIEVAKWNEIGIDRFKFYLCHPHSPWERPSNENTNRQARYWLRHRTDLSRFSQLDLDKIAHIINTTPRRIHNWQTAHRLYHQLMH